MDSVERKLLVGFFGALAVLLAMLIFSYGSMSGFIAKTRDLVNTHSASRKLEKIAVHFAAAQAGQQRFMSSGKRADLQACQDAFFAIERLAAEIRRLSRDQDAPLKRLLVLEPMVVGQVKRLEGALDRAQKQGLPAARGFLGQNEGRRAMQGIAAVLADFRADEAALMAGQSADVESMTQGVGRRMAAGIILSLAIFTVLFWVIHAEMRHRRAVEASLASQTSILRTVLNSLNDPVLVFGDDFKLIVSNPAAEKLLGSPPKLFDEYPLIQALLGREIKNVVMNFKRGDGGESVFLDTSARPFLDPDGKPAGGIVVFHDISEIKKDEAALLDSIDQDISEIKNEEIALLDSNKALEQRVGLLKQHSRDTLALSRLVETLQVCRSKDEVCAAASKSLTGFIEPSFGAIHLLDAAGAVLERAVSWGGQSASAPAFSAESCLALRRRQASLLDSGAGKACGHFTRPLPYHAVCVPITAPGEALGHLEICSAASNDAFMNPERLRLITVMAEQLGLALANLRLHAALKNESIHDPLTGAFNRRHLDESLAIQMANSRRSRTPLALAMFDIDFFKKFNDSYGHKAGDLVLQRVAHCIEKSLRQGDQLYRYGGEEFTAVLPGVDSHSALIAAEKSRLAVSALKLEYQGQALESLSVSIGIACFPEGAGNPEELIRHADQALYEAKHGGRNRSIAWPDLKRPEAA